MFTSTDRVPAAVVLKAAPHRLYLRWFDHWCRRAIRRQFFRLHRYGDPHWLKRFDARVPRIYVANHSSFWDGVVLFHLIREHLRQPAYCMVDATQMKEHPFFRRVGGFGVDRGNPRAAAAAIGYAVQLLRRPVALVVFPQGRICPVEQRPLRLEGGIARICQRSESAQFIPVALRYEFWEEQRGEAMIHVGEPLACREINRLSRPKIMQLLNERLTAGCDDLRRQSTDRQEGEVLLRGKPSISRWKQIFRGANRP